MLKVVNQNKTIYTPTDQTYTKLLLHGNNLLDYSGNAHVVTANGDATFNNSGNPFGNGGVISIDGDGDYFTIPDSPDLDFGTGDFVIDFWLKRHGVSQDGGILGASINTPLGYIVHFSYVSTDTLIFSSTASGSFTDDIIFNTAVTDETWTHIAIVRDGNTLRTFQNGASAGTLDVTGYVFDSSGDGLVLGRYYTNVTGNYADIDLAELRIYKGGNNNWTGSTIDIPTKPYALGSFN